MPQGITNQLFRKVTVFSQSGPSVAAGVGTDVEFDSAVYRQLFQVIVQFPQGMLVFCILFFAFPVSTENGKQVGGGGVCILIPFDKVHGSGRNLYGEQGSCFVAAVGGNGILQVCFA